LNQSSKCASGNNNLNFSCNILKLLPLFTDNQWESNKINMRIARFNGIRRNQTIRSVAQYYEGLRRGPSSNIEKGTDIAFLSNERNLCRFIVPAGRLKTTDKGGLVAGVGIGGAIETYALYARAEALCYLDYNPAITHVIAPALGILLMESKTLRGFCSNLASTDKNPLLARDYWSETHFNEEYCRDVVGNIFRAVDPFLEDHEKLPAQEVLNEYFRLFDSGPPSYWDVHMYQRPEGNCKFWMTTKQGFEYVKGLWEQGRVYGFCLDLAKPSIDTLKQTLGPIGVPMSLFYSSNALGWLSGPYLRGEINGLSGFSAAMQNMVANILSIPRQKDAVLLSTWVGGCTGGSLPLKDVDYLNRNSQGHDFAHLLQLFLMGARMHFFGDELNLGVEATSLIENVAEHAPAEIGMSGFCKGEFRGGLTVRKLCQTINADGINWDKYGAAFHSPDYTIERLNEILQMPNLSAIISEAGLVNRLGFSKQMVRLMSQAQLEGEDLLFMNRMFLEELYPESCPQLEEQKNLRKFLNVLAPTEETAPELIFHKLNDPVLGELRSFIASRVREF